ncbi:MAG: cupin domain-containing protein [Oceanospirillaceae bacterium]|nr:cupin domain-containing protein [Oceanospirillaceae bacterium]
MKKYRLDDFTRGWFVGDFSPTIIRTQDVEVAVQKFEAGTEEAEHVHKVATELTLILSGRVEISGVEYQAGEIVEIPPGEYARFKAIEASTTVVVKYPGAKNDKYLKGHQCD